MFQFVAHPTVQQQMSTLWYDGVPGFRRKHFFGQCLQIVKIGVVFPYYSLMYILFPRSRAGKVVKKPFVKFVANAFSYLLFLREYLRGEISPVGDWTMERTLALPHFSTLDIGISKGEPGTGAHPLSRR